MISKIKKFIKLQTLKEKIYAIVFLSFILRIITFFALPSTPSFLAPDEGTYASLASWIANSNPATEFPGFGESLYLSGRSVVIPSSLLVRIGFNELDAARLISSLYAFIALIIISTLIVKSFQNSSLDRTTKRFNENLTLSLLAIFAFLPSHFIWSNLGLREAANEFWLVIAFILLYFIYKTPNQWSIMKIITLAFSIIFVFSSRPQVGWVLVVSILIFLLSQIRYRITFVVIPFLLAGMMGGYLATTSFGFTTRDVFEARLNPTVSAMATKEFQASKLCVTAGGEVFIDGIGYLCVKKGEKKQLDQIKNLVAVAIDQVEGIPGRQIGNQIGAASQIKIIGCPFDPETLVGKYSCIAWRAPYSTFTFLFRPLPFLDTTSASSNLAAAENMLWMAAFGLILFGLIKRRQVAFKRELAPAFIFFVLYVVGAGSYEGNMGTAFRHKSLILWVVLLMIFAIFYRKESDSKEENHRNS